MGKDNDFELLSEHIKKVLDVYREMKEQELYGDKAAKDYKERFYQLVDHKNEVL